MEKIRLKKQDTGTIWRKLERVNKIKEQDGGNKIEGTR